MWRPSGAIPMSEHLKECKVAKMDQRGFSDQWHALPGLTDVEDFEVLIPGMPFEVLMQMLM